MTVTAESHICSICRSCYFHFYGNYTVSLYVTNSLKDTEATQNICLLLLMNYSENLSVFIWVSRNVWWNSSIPAQRTHQSRVHGSINIHTSFHTYESGITANTCSATAHNTCITVLLRPLCQCRPSSHVSWSFICLAHVSPILTDSPQQRVYSWATKRQNNEHMDWK